MPKPRRARTTQRNRQALRDARETLKALKEVNRWQRGLIEQLETEIEHIQGLLDSAEQSRRCG